MMYNLNVHERQIMSTSVAQSRQQLSSLIEAAQTTPQVITKRNTPVAVLVSADYFKRTEAAAHSADSFYNTLIALRAEYAPSDNQGLGKAGTQATRSATWTRANSFTDSE
jgi:prevent-host-death family protein